ncbi:hypothetical protein [Streptomyces sp. NPDC003077]|uniref:hypothetical protein n=1 Tax=Streptomyces sp. NPDC003077 TaxID=3154443 RepID=UPI0033A552DC
MKERHGPPAGVPDPPSGTGGATGEGADQTDDAWARDERQRARLAVAQHAQDAEDLALLIEMLDLRPERDAEVRRGSGRTPGRDGGPEEG